MARKTDDDEAPKKKSAVERHLAVWLLLAMIVTGLGGWGVTNFGRSVNAIGSVGDREIPADDYARSLQASLNRFAAQLGTKLTIDQAQALGLDRQVLQGLVLRTAMEAEADRLGLSVGDMVVAEQVKSNKAFQTGGTFDRETYRGVLQQNRLTEKAYEASVRSDITRQVLAGAVTGGLSAPATLTDALYAYRLERRGFTALELTKASLPQPVPAPTEAELQTYYDAHIDAFTRPAGKRITYAALRPETLAPSITPDDKAVEDLYNARADQYHIPEKRLVERLVYPTEDEAKAAKARLDAGQATFEDLVKERGLALEDIDMGDVARADLAEAGGAVFALDQGGVAGPLPSALGPALFRVNGILAAQDITLEAARPDLVKELQLEAAKKDIAAKVEVIDDALAGGATLQDLAQEQGMTLATIDYAPGADDNDPITADKGFAAQAAKAAVGDYAEAVSMEDGGIVAMTIDADLPAAPIPLDKASAKVAAAWTAERLHADLVALGDEIQTKVQGGESLGAFGITSRTAPATRDHVPQGLPAEVLAAVFAMAPGETRLVETPDWVGLVRLDEVVAAPQDGDIAKVGRDQIGIELRKTLADDVNALYGRALLGQNKVSLDQTAINAVNASIR